MTFLNGIRGMETVRFSGQDCVALENEALRLLITKSVGPRILSLSLHGSQNLLAVLPDFITDCPGVGPFHFYGGHRLWDAPEVLTRTYLPDDLPVDITSIENGVAVTQPTEPRTGLTNHSLWEVACAPWAITQFRTGGVAILPQITEDTGVLPNRPLALWPYTDLADPNVMWGRDLILAAANMRAPFKLGFPNPRGWLAYWLDGILFVKHASYDAQARY